MTGHRTGIFYHPSYSRRSYLTVGARLADFPMVLDTILRSDRIKLYEPGPIPLDLLLKVHTPDMIEGVKRDPLCSTAWHSAMGVVMAGEKIAEGEIANAFAFIGAGGHHSGKSYFGGYCCFNDVALCIVNLREKHGLERFAIVDTDAHHGDGTRDLFSDDPDILHVCICGTDYESPDGTKVDVAYPSPWWGRGRGEDRRPMNDVYFELVEKHVPRRVREFKPDLLFWYFGFDTHRGDYGDIGLTAPCFMDIARLMLDVSEEACGGRLAVVLGGGSHTKLATSLIPPIIEGLAGLKTGEPPR
ncbi:MAG: histone deacetylase [Deltaproteobacteria bacterium]|nr:histone deacetylase [Deltaproteobacteria bacterium]NIS77316.1 histone deacetylase [Deltaproteobacteria bacterium]